jgi:hypothetical protein
MWSPNLSELGQINGNTPGPYLLLRRSGPGVSGERKKEGGSG